MTIPACVVGTYRCYLRQVKRLPVPYLRHFYQVKVANDIRAVLRSTDKLREKRIKRIKKDLHRIEAANNGCSRAFQHVLELAYGRKGKLRRELMEPLLSDLDAPVPPRIIPSVESSRPPAYSPELRALLASSVSYRSKPLDQKSLDNPPTLPARANPTSEEARLLGPLSKRREVNWRWRYFSRVCSRVLPPLKSTTDSSLVPVPNSASHVWGQSIHDEVEALVNPAAAQRPITRKERLNGHTGPRAITQLPRHPSRWIRRRYQELLASLPILTYSLSKESSTTKRCSVTGSTARLVRADASSPHLMSGLPPVDAMDWFARAQQHMKR